MTAGNNGNPALSIFKTIRLPTTTNDFDEFFLSGKQAIIPNLCLEMVVGQQAAIPQTHS